MSVQTAESVAAYVKKVQALHLDPVFLTQPGFLPNEPVSHIQPSTIAWEVQALAPGGHLRAHRHSSSTVYHVIEGSGTTIVNGQELSWAEHDTFVLPTWCWHEHVNASRRERAVLFSFNDEPAFRALGLYREEAHAKGVQ